MQCLNIKNPEVAALLKEYTDILGSENAAYYVLSENNGYGLDRAPNGAPSKLFSDLLSHYNGDNSRAIQAKAQVYSESFKNWFGDWTKLIDANDTNYDEAVDFLFDINPELRAAGTKMDYKQYIKTIFPNSILDTVYWHGTDSDFSDGLRTAKRGRGSGAPETQNEMYFNRQPWASLQYISGVNRKIKDIDGFNNWVKLWWELKEALGNGRMDTDDWKNEIIGPNTRQYSPNKRGIFDRDKGGTHGKYLSERKARYGYANRSDKEFFEEVFDIRYGKETFNDWIDRKRNEFKNIWNNREVKKGIVPAVLNVQNPIIEEGQNTYYEEQRGLFTRAKQNGNDAILSNKSKNEFGSDVAIVFNPVENVHFLGTKSDIENFKKWRSNSQVSKVVDDNGEPLVVYHGTNATISDFNYRGDREFNPGFFFTSDRNYATSVAEARQGNIVMPVFLRMMNPIYSNTDLVSKDIESIFMFEGERDSDGIIGHDIYTGEFVQSTGNEYLVTRPNQIKSIDNQGTFSTQDNNIYRDYQSIQNSSDPSAFYRLFNGKDTVSASEILDRIADTNPALTPLTKVLSKLKKDVLEDVKIIYKPVHSDTDDINAAAVYNADDNTIVIFGDSRFKGKDGLVDSTILHELVHAATIYALNFNPRSRESAQKLLDYAREQLGSKYGKTWQELTSSEGETFYGLTNVEEFFAEAFANSNFIKELYQIKASKPSGDASFISDLVNWIMGVLDKMFRPNRNNLYNETMGELERVMFLDNFQLEGFDEAAYNEAIGSLPEFYDIQRTSDETKIKQIFTQQSNHINFEADSHTYTNSATGDIYTPVSVVKDLHGYGADISAMSDETLAYGEYAAKVGTAIHDFIHSELTGQKVQPSEVKLADSAKKMIRKVVLPKLMGKNDTLLASEQVISNDSAKIAGTLDLLIKDENGKIHLKDFKTKARTFKGEGKYGFDYYFSAKKETKEGGKPDAARHNYQLTMYKRMLELLGINVDHKEIVPLEYTVNEDGVVTEVWIPELPYAQPDGSIYHRTDNALEQEINQTILSSDPNATTSDIDSDNLVNQSEIVANILKVLKNQLAISRVKGYTTRAETLKKFIDDLNSMEESEVMVAYINESLKMLKPLIDEYNEGLKAERNGDTAAWNLRKLEAWKNYAESYANLDDIQNYLFLNPNALSFLSKGDLMKIKEALATAINYKNLLENAYKSKGERIWLDWLTPFTSRVEAEYRVAAEREYKKRNKGTDAIKDTAAMNRYIDQYVQSHRNEINLKSRELLRQQSKIATSSPISTLSRWLDNVFESADPIVGSMARAYHTQWMESMQEFNNMYAQLVSLTEELENAYPSFRSNPAKLYDFMIESDENGSHLISRLPLSFYSAYEKAKKEINANPKYETSKDKAVAIAAWLNDNAPIDGVAALNREKIKVIDDLLNRGRITPKEHKFLINNEKRDQSLKRSWADMVYRKQITEDVADYLRTKFNELNWQYRKPDSKKYPNSKWEALEKVRQSNPQDIRVRFFDFITALDKKGNSFVPERFKLNGRLPGMSKNAAERLVSDGIVSQLARGVRNEFTLTADETDRGMQMTDELDRPIKFVPIYFTNTLPAEEQSLDISTIYKEWFRSVNNYKYINEILPQLEYTKWVIENRKTIKTDSKGNPIKNVLSKVMNNGDSDIDPTTNALVSDENLIAQVNAWFDQVIYGVSTRDLGTTMGLDNAKMLNLFQKYTSLKIMGVNVVSMVNNALMAEVQQTMEAFAGQYVSAASYTKASGEYVQDIPNILADVGSRKITSLTNLLNEHFGVFTEFNNGSMLDNNAIKKLSKVSTLYFTTNVGEHEAQSRFLLAALIEKRALDKNGKDIGSMYDYFTVENGKLVFDKEHKVANFSRQDQIAFGQQVTAILRKMHGNYASYSPVALQQYGFGKLLLMFCKWIWATGKRRWAKEYYDEYGQTFSKGYYRDGGAFYYNKVRSFIDRFINEARALEYAEKADWETMTEAEKANVKRFTTEIGIFATLSVMSMLLNYVDTDDDETLDMLLSHLDYQLFRLSIDMTFYISPASFMKIVQSPLPSSSVIKDVSDLFESMLDPFARFEKGDWKGELKIKKRAMDLIPLVRQIYRIRNIDDERQLLSIL